MAVDNWSEFLVKLVLGSTEKEWWTKYLCAVAANWDRLSERLTQTMRAGWIHRGQLPADTLQIVGSDSLLEQYPNETNEQFQARVLERWDSWQYAGHQTALEAQLRAAGFTNATVVTYSDRLGPRGEAAPYWSQFWVRIPLATLQLRTGWTTAPEWGSVVWGCFWWDYGALSLADGLLFWSIVRKFKPNDWVCRGIELSTWA